MNPEVAELVEALREGNGTVDGRQFNVLSQGDEMVLYYNGRQVLDPDSGEPLRFPSDPTDEQWHDQAVEMLARASVLENGSAAAETPAQTAEEPTAAPADDSLEAEWVCSECGFVAQDKRGLRAHERSHLKSTCPACGREMSAVGMAAHLRWHENRGEWDSAEAAVEATGKAVVEALSGSSSGATVERERDTAPAKPKRRYRKKTKPSGKTAVPEQASVVALEVLAELLQCGTERGTAVRIATRILDLERPTVV